MKSILYIAVFFFSFSLTAQPTIDYVVQTWAEINVSPANITVHWKAVNGANSYIIYKKEKSESSWGVPLATIDKNITFYEDTDVEIETSYEYKIKKTGSVIAYGYINAGIEIPPTHHRGKIILLVDSLFSNSLSEELSQLTLDLIAEGWEVIKHDVSRESNVMDVKQIIIDEYNTSPENFNAVFCFGHIPVPYSGNLNPDGHGNHKGAWPADGFYGDIDGNWTDQFVTNTTASQERNHNIPGDGKFDQAYFASELELQVGRVDFANMPAFSLSEEELLKRYLIKDHAFRTGDIKVKMQGVIDDNFGGFNGEAFAGSAWKSFSPMLHPDNVANGDYRASMDTSSYMWSYGCGGGSFVSCNGIGKTTDFAGDSLNGIFSCLFGSYFGDWDSKNNIMRATIAQGTILTNCWSGRPHWYFHHMALGENIGYSTKLSMNNKGVFYNSPLSFLGNIVSMGLMGDPSLRMHFLSSPSDLTATFNEYDVELNWTASADSALGYYIYRSDKFNNQYTLLNDTPVFETNFIDECIDTSGQYFYMVRATKLQETPSGSYFNLSPGIFTNIQTQVLYPEASFSLDIDTNKIVITNTSVNSDNWEWNFGDDSTSVEFEPVHFYKSPGDYEIKLIASNNCFKDSTSNSVSLFFTKTSELITKSDIYIIPNPVTDKFSIEGNSLSIDSKMKIFNCYGKEVKTVLLKNNINEKKFSLGNMPSGIYFIQIIKNNKSTILKIIKQ